MSILDRGRALLAKREVLLVALFVSAYAYFFPRWADWNQNSRVDVVLAIVDQGTLSIDSYYQNTGDYALFEGHYYGEKAPGTSFLGVPVYLAFKMTGGRLLTDVLLPILGSSSSVATTLHQGGRGLVSDSLHFAAVQYVLTFAIVALPSALLCLVLFRFLDRLSDSAPIKLLLTILYGLGTIAFPYSNAYYGHQVTAILLFLSFWLLFRIRQGELETGYLVLVGFLLGYSVITEYPTVFPAGALFVYGFLGLRDKREAAWMVVGGLLPVWGLMLYNTAIFGYPWEFSYKYSELWVDYHHTGFFGTTLPNPRALWELLFGTYRGLFFRSPFLLLALPGFYYAVREKRWRAEALVSLVIFLVVLLFTSSSKMWFGGHSVGPRYLVPALPFLVWPIVFVLDRLRRTGWGRVIVGLLAGASIVLVWLETVSGQGYPQYSLFPLFDYSLPRFAAGDVARNIGTVVGLSRWYSLVPLLLWMVLLVALLWRTANPRGGPDGG